MNERDEPSAGRDFVQSLERGLAVIEAFDESSPVQGLSEVSRKTGLTRAASRRFLLTLVELGYMRNDGGKFSLRPRILNLGHAYLSSLSLPEVALPQMRALAADTHESTSLSVLDEEEIVYVAQVTATRPMAVRIDVGTRFPAYATGMGRVLLANAPEEWLAGYFSRVELLPFTDRTITSVRELRATLEAVRRDGFAHVDRELDYSLRALAVPIRNRNGTVVAALNVSTHAQPANSADVVSNVLPLLQRSAAVIEADLAAKALTG